MLDIDKIREHTPACSRLIHFNNAGSSLSPGCVTDAVNAHLELEQEIGGYEAADQAAAATRAIYQNISSLIGCHPNEIALVENATRAWQLATLALDLKAGDEVITSDMEYSSNYMGLLHLARQRGIGIRMVQRGDDGIIDLAALEKSVNKYTRAIFLTHVASHCGDIQPAQAIGDIARSHQLFYVLDACQSIGQIDIDVGAIGCDFLAASGRKFLRGPRGTGFLYINWARCGALAPPFVDLHSASWNSHDSYHWHDDARAYEIWEQNVAANLGLGQAAAYALDLGMNN
ncbi:MAG: aminotransferase class V-fold PLP-dependent enzyme, partial [Gammaproteobacteria bacterium]